MNPLLLNMKRGLWTALRTLVLLNLLTACGGGSATADAGTGTGTALGAKAWVVLGSSSAAGVGAGRNNGWVALLTSTANALLSPMNNLARSGAVTFQALPAASARPADRPATVASMDIDGVLAGAPGLLILAFPSNDAMAGYAASETIANLLTLRAKALAANVPVLLVSSQPRDDASAAQRATMIEVDRALAANAAACFVDVRVALSGAEGRIASELSAGDGVHLNDAGHQRVFELVSATITAGRCAGLGEK